MVVRNFLLLCVHYIPLLISGGGGGGKLVLGGGGGGVNWSLGLVEIQVIPPK